MTPTNKKSRYHWRPFEKARQFVRSLDLKNKDEWGKWSKSGELPNDIPANPVQVYKTKGWVSWGDWLGTGRVANQGRVYLSFDDARAFVHKIGLKSRNRINRLYGLA